MTLLSSKWTTPIRDIHDQLRNPKRAPTCLVQNKLGTVKGLSRKFRIYLTVRKIASRTITRKMTINTPRDNLKKMRHKLDSMRTTIRLITKSLKTPKPLIKVDLGNPEMTKHRQECPMNLRSKFTPKVVLRSRRIRKTAKVKKMLARKIARTKSEWATTWCSQIKPEMRICSVNQF